jgi:hypothetical protein
LLAKGKYFQHLLKYGNTNPNIDYNTLMERVDPGSRQIGITATAALSIREE